MKETDCARSQQGQKILKPPPFSTALHIIRGKETGLFGYGPTICLDFESSPRPQYPAKEGPAHVSL
jgi:hypothetical protein